MGLFLVESGQGEAGGNSYVTAQEAADYFTQKNVVIPAQFEPILINAFMFVNTYSTVLLGEKTFASTIAEWPRKNTGLDWLTENTVPEAVKLAQMEAAIYGATAPLFIVDTGRGNVLRQKIGPIETEYADTQTSGGGGSTVFIPVVFQLLQKFFRSSSGQARVYRG